MRKNKILLVIATIVLVGSILACGIQPAVSTPTPVPTYTPYPTPTPVPTELPKPPVTTEAPIWIEGIDTPITVTWDGYDVKIQLTRVFLANYVMDTDGNTIWPKQAGDIFFIVEGWAYSNGPQIGVWSTGYGMDSVHLITQDHQYYWWDLRQYPTENSGTIDWFFQIPPDALPGLIAMPDGTSINITTLPIIDNRSDSSQDG